MEPESQKKFLIRFCYAAVVLLLTLLGVKILFYWLFPFAAGLAIAVLLRPAIRKLSKAALLPRKHAAVMITTLMYLVILAVLWFLAVNTAGLAANVISSAANALPGFMERLSPFLTRTHQTVQTALSRLSPRFSGAAFDFTETVMDQLSGLSAAAVSWAGKLAASVPSLLFTLTLTVLASFLIAMDYPRVTAFILAQIPKKWQEILFRCRQFLTGQLLRILRGYLIIMFITFCELAAGFWLLKIPAPFQKAALIALLDILPLIGTGGVLIPWAMLELIQGNRFLAIGIGILYAIIAVVRTITEPKIIGDQTGLPPLVTLTAMYVGWKLAGFAGIIGAPLVVLLLCWMQENGILRLWKTAE